MTNTQLGVVAGRNSHLGVSCVHGVRGRRKLGVGKADLQSRLHVKTSRKKQTQSAIDLSRKPIYLVKAGAPG